MHLIHGGKCLVTTIYKIKTRSFTIWTAYLYAIYLTMYRCNKNSENIYIYVIDAKECSGQVLGHERRNILTEKKSLGLCPRPLGQ